MSPLQQALDGLTTGSIYALVALGFSLIFQTSALLSFAHPQLMMLGALAGYSLLTSLKLPFIMVLVGSALFSALVSVLIELAILRPMRQRAADENGLIVVTIGTGVILVSAAMLLWGPYSLPYPHPTEDRPFHIGGATLQLKSIIVWIAALSAVVALQVFLRHTRWGISMRAAAVDSTTATLVGIPVRSTTAISFGLSGALAGIAGVLISSIYYASFELGAVGLKGVCAAVIGGFGNLWGAVLGGLLLGIFESFFTVYVSAQLVETFVYGLLILVLLLWPNGLLGAVQRKV